MRILRLGTSNDQEGRVAHDRMTHVLLEEQLAEATGQHWETMVRSTWPTPALPGLVERWANEFQPDVVIVRMPAFWFAYESVPLKLRRKLGRFGEPMAQFGLKRAADPRWAGNPVFRAGRKLAQRTIGGDTHFTPEQVIEVMGEVIRVLARRESTTIAVKLPTGVANHYPSAAMARRGEARRLKVSNELLGLCNQLHIETTSSARPWYLAETLSTGRDKFHADEAGHEVTAGRDLELILRALCRSGAIPVGATSAH